VQEQKEKIGMVNIKPNWEIKGIYQEACASEGHCPFYFGRNKEGGCRYFSMYTITEGLANGIDLSGVKAIYIGDLPYATFQEVTVKGAKGAIYISDDTSPEQRELLDILSKNVLGGALMKEVLGIQYVKIDVEADDETVHVKIPTGEMKMTLTKNKSGDHVGLTNQTLPFLSNVKAAHTSFWNWSDYDRSYEYKNRCGTWADFMFKPMAS
jgi:hypothetical protein